MYGWGHLYALNVRKSTSIGQIPASLFTLLCRSNQALRRGTPPPSSETGGALARTSRVGQILPARAVRCAASLRVRRALSTLGIQL